MKKGLFIFFIFLTGIVWATGPSSIDAEIQPVSINSKGEILCKTRFSANPMGAHWLMPVEYGLCIITQDTLIQYNIYRFSIEDNEDWEKAIQRYDSLQSDFNSIPNADYFRKIRNVLGKDYNFTSYNVESYKVDKIYTLPEFEKRWKINLQINPQKALNKALSTTYTEENTLQVLYDFGSVLLISNERSYGEEKDFETGAEFDYYNPWTDQKGEEQNIGFDLFTITGVLWR